MRIAMIGKKHKSDGVGSLASGQDFINDLIGSVSLVLRWNNELDLSTAAFDPENGRFFCRVTALLLLNNVGADIGYFRDWN